jgi:carboxypeptidase family protein/TonB-dependent receptor-like protein
VNVGTHSVTVGDCALGTLFIAELRGLKEENAMSISRVRLFCFFAALTSLMLAVSMAYGQNENNGEVRGVVSDTSGAFVPDATVVLRNLGTGVSQTTKTGSAGVYDFPFVPPGNYNISFTKIGFTTLTESGISTHVGTTVANATLQVGHVESQVSVAANVEKLQTDTSERSAIIPTIDVTEMPNVAQDWTALTQLVPGIASNGGATTIANFVQGSGAGNSFNGSMPYQSQWLIDGGSVTYPADQNLNLSYGLPLDTVQEVSINTMNYGAQYSTGTSVFNVVTKSGSNQFHGSLFEFVQNNILDSRNYFSPIVPPTRFNEFGGTIGGPIKRNKAFFFFSFQYNPLSTPTSGFATVPTALMRAGNFSEICTNGFDLSGLCTDRIPTATGAACPPGSAYGPGTTCAIADQIYNPATTQLVGGQLVRNPFQGNVIPGGMLSPVSLAVQQYFPNPNRTGLVNNYFTVIGNTSKQKWIVPKVDYNINDNNRVSVSGSIVPYPSSTAGGPFPLVETWTDAGRDQRWNITDNWTFSSSFVGEFHLAEDRWVPIITTISQGKGYPAKIGLQNAPADIFPSVNIQGATGTFIGPGATARMYEGGYMPSAVLSLTKGKHLIRFGGEFNKMYYDGNGWGGIQSGNFTFSGLATLNPADPNSVGLGSADFILGDAQAWNATETPEEGLRSWNFGLFLEDDIKLTPTLTLNIGMRYTGQDGWGEQYHRLGAFDPNLINPATNTPGAMWFGDSPNNLGRRNVQYGSFNNWAPRFGIAWSPRKTWVFRGAYGIFDQMWGSDTFASGAEAVGYSPVNAVATQDNITPALNWGQPLPNLIVIPPSKLNPASFNGQAVAYYPIHTPMPYVQQAHLSVQHEFARFVGDVAYVWTKGTHLPFQTDINQVPANRLGPGNAQANRPYPNFLNIFGDPFNGYSNYNALQTSLRRQFSGGLSLIANYTWAHSLDTGSSSGWGGGGVDNWQIGGNPRANYGNSTFDTPQMFNGGIVYQLPFGRGKPFLNQGGVLNPIVGGWQLSTIWQVSSGVPFTPVAASDTSGSLSYEALRPNVVGNPRSGTCPNGAAVGTINCWYNTSAFAQPAQYTFGDSGRNFLFGPAYRSVNISLAKDFLIREGLRFQLRADGTNAFNHTNFALPNNQIGNLAAGTITSVYTGAAGSGQAGGSAPNRIIQLGAKLSF